MRKRLPISNREVIPSIASRDPGLGDSGHGWADIADMFRGSLPHVKWIFPHAYGLRSLPPSRPR